MKGFALLAALVILGFFFTFGNSYGYNYYNGGQAYVTMPTYQPGVQAFITPSYYVMPSYANVNFYAPRPMYNSNNIHFSFLVNP